MKQNPRHAWQILKFGGKSLANGKPLERALEIIAAAAEAGPIAVVVSARGHTTDDLLALYEEAIAGRPYEGRLQQLAAYQTGPGGSGVLACVLAELEKVLAAVATLRTATPGVQDKVVAYGEILSAKLVVHLLEQKGLKAEFVDARNLLKVKSRPAGHDIDCRLSETLTQAYFKSLRPGQIPVITGFIASDERNETVTLGRNGSNLTTSLIAGFMEAAEVQNWTDVDGIYTANPRYVPHARLIERLSYKEAYELANFGAAILHPRTIEPLMKKGIPLKIFNSLVGPNTGTLIDREGSGRGIKAVSVVEKVALITLESSRFAGRIGIDGRIFSALGRYHISVRLIAQASSELGIGFVVDAGDAVRARQILEEEFAPELAEETISAITVNKNMAIIAILGRHNYALEKAIYGLRRNRIWMHLISNSISGAHISLVIDSRHLKKAVNVVHNQVFGAIKTLNLFAFGKGTVGGELIDQILATTGEVEQRRKLKINVIGVADSQKAIIRPGGLDPGWREELAAATMPSRLDKILDALAATGLENIVLADNTSSRQLADCYTDILERGFDIVASNKKANSGSMEAYRAIRGVLQRRGRQFYYETNVGAGLPLIDTLRHIQDSADRVTRVRGIFSGSLSYIFNTFSAGDRPFSEVLLEARRQGLTEPDPREDLQGEDVARKLVILARELGMEVEVGEVEVESLIPAPLTAVPDWAGFIARKDLLDEHFAARRDALAPGHVLRYVGELEVTSGSLRVALQEMPATSALGSVGGADAVFEIYTASYGSRPVVIRGAGAGAEVTARGVYSDLLRLARQY